MKKLLRSGTDPNSVDKQTYHTALMEAAARDCTVCLELLLDSGADPNRLNNYGGTGLRTAVSAGKCNSVRLLLKRGAKVNETKYGRTLLQEAQQRGYDDVARLLKQYGASN